MILPRLSRIVLPVMLGTLALSGPAMAAPLGRSAAQVAVATQAFTVDFGDFQSKAELTYPANAAAGSPAVILIHGAGPADMDFTVSGGNGAPVSHIFKDIADYYTPRGVAVLRYNKHYVAGPNQADVAKYAMLDLTQIERDAEQVLLAAEHNPHVNAHRIYLYGWSEGSVIAAALAARHPEVAGLIVQGPVAEPWRDTIRYQILRVGLPYALSFAADGKITADVLQKAFTGSGGLTAKGDLIYFIDQSFNQTHQVTVNSFLDANGDGALDPSSEITPGVERLLDLLFSPQGPFGIYGPGRTLPTVTEQAPTLTLPVLILQGANDANVPAAGAQTLDSVLAGHADHTLKVYAGLGHSLGPAGSISDDGFRPIAAAPMDDTLAWIAAHMTGSAPGMPRTGAPQTATVGELLLLAAGLCLLGRRLRRSIAA